MERISWFKIGKKVYPLCLSIGARKRLEEQYESVTNFLQACSDNDRVQEAYMYGLETLIMYGCKRLNYLDEGTMIQDGSMDEQGNWIPIGREDLETMICHGQFPEIEAKILETINKAAAKEIKAEPTAETRKKANATSEVTA